jgi:ABC-type amino acid transport substrate-binding protein
VERAWERSGAVLTHGAFLLAPLLLAGGDARAADLPEIKARGVLRIVASSTTDALFFSTDANAPGLLHELLRGFAALHELKLETQSSTTEQRVRELMAGRADVIPMTSYDADAAQVAFSAEVFPKVYVAVTRTPVPPVRTVAELRKQKLGIHGRNRQEMLARLGVPFTDVGAEADVLTLLRGGSFDATVVSLDSALVAQARDPDLHVGMVVGDPVSRVFGVRKTDAALLAALNDCVANTRKSGAWQRLVVRYFGPRALEILKTQTAAR